MGSAGETEVASLTICKNAVVLRRVLNEMGHLQPKTIVITENSTAEGLINKTMTPRRAKTYDQRTNWLKCREAQKQFNIIWKSGKVNRAEYHSKTHPVSVYQGKISDYVAAAA